MNGTNSSNAGYEYIVKPSTTNAAMETLHSTISSGGKPYTVHQKGANAHIVQSPSKSMWGYEFFNSLTNLAYANSLVKAVNASSLVMTEYNAAAHTILLSIVNPDIGIKSNRSHVPVDSETRALTLHGEWVLDNGPYAGVQILSSTAEQTVIEFTLKMNYPKKYQ